MLEHGLTRGHWFNRAQFTESICHHCAERKWLISLEKGAGAPSLASNGAKMTLLGPQVIASSSRSKASDQTHISEWDTMYSWLSPALVKTFEKRECANKHIISEVNTFELCFGCTFKGYLYWPYWPHFARSIRRYILRYRIWRFRSIGPPPTGWQLLRKSRFPIVSTM